MLSYWTFADIFEENGPVPSPFHGGIGLLNFQGLRKPAFYAYHFLNRLGDVELTSNDASSWACRSSRGVQLVFWNYTALVTTESNQAFFKRDLPANSLGNVRVTITGLPAGRYQMNIYQVGHHRKRWVCRLSEARCAANIDARTGGCTGGEKQRSLD